MSLSDSGFQRRAPPSPLVFSPDTVLPPIPSHAPQTHASSSNTVSMPFVRRHVMRRLKNAKAECDKELQRVTNSITAWFEERLREGELEREAEREARERERERERGRDRFQLDTPFSEADFGLREPFGFEPRSAFMSDDASSDGGYDAEPEAYHSQQRASLEEDNPRHRSLTHSSSSPGLLTASTSSSSPSSLRRQNTNGSNLSTSDLSSSRRQSNTIPRSGASVSRRLSRTIHIPQRPVRSAQSSRSTSRSRSPLPPTARSSFSETVGSPNNRRSSRILLDDPIDPIMTALYDLIALATDVTEMTVAQLTSQPKLCENFVQRVQNIGKAWEEHPDWHGRNWYVQVLLAVASLSRVVEWWEAEKQFWNFDDNDNEEDEPLLFVMKPAEDEDRMPAPTPTIKQEPPPGDGGAIRLSPEDESKLRMTRTTSYGRKSRDEARKDLSHAEKEPTKGHPKSLDQAESARVLATERLRLQAETAQSRNIVMELDLDGDHIQWVNYAWRVVVGNEPDELFEARISRLLAPSDWNVFKDATQRLQENDSRNVEVKFKIQVQPEEEREGTPGLLYQQMEGQGMLMVDRDEGRATHTMWVVRPVGAPEYQHTPTILLESGEEGEEPLLADEVSKDLDQTNDVEPPTPFPLVRPINLTPILCRICECNIPQYFFEKHNETCSETHRLEAEIGDCNESIMELRNTIRDLSTAMDRSSPATAPEYRGMPIFSPSSSPSSPSPLQLFRGPFSGRMQRMGVKKMQRRLLEQLEDVLQVASEISVPTLKEEEQKEPIERQRLLSPASERKMTQIRNWSRPPTEDAALGQLVEDAERVMRQKVDNVIRMQNTIKYAERIRQEWEEQVASALSSVEEIDAECADDDGGQSTDDQEGDDHSSTTSEYAFKGEEPSSDPTPMASTSPIPIPTPTPGVGDSRAIVCPAPMLPPQPLSSAAVYQHQPFVPMHTGSSTPSSISSPLALAAPIVASPSPENTPPPIDLNDISSRVIKGRSSAQNLEPKVLITPPLSPMLSPRDIATTRRPRRRHSTALSILSPTTILPGGPLSGGQLSPRLPSVAPPSRSNATSIKDFDIIKPISKGAFGSVFLAKKKVTGDYYAIKVLKKADMIAKNQITNVKAERMILMKQAESPFVAKLYFTFQSKDNLYLVMEYLNGGDCAALIKSLGSLPEEWAKNYIAEVVLALEYLHNSGIVHRDLKPDNLLIDQHGHLKLTDFGLSRIGLLGRQTREGQYLPERGLRPRTRYSPGSRPPSMDAAYLSSPLIPADILSGGSYFSQRTHSVPRVGSSPYIPSPDDASDSGSELAGILTRRNGTRGNDSPLQSFATELTTDLRSHSTSGLNTPPSEQKFVGTPDYLAPETILGLRGDDAAVDWWALGVVSYEFLYGIPPFHAETPERVFENILSGHIEWHEDWIEFTDEARDFMQRLMFLDPSRRLGANGANEVKSHPWLEDIEWDKVTTSEAAFIPQVTDPESTDYFDPRGAIPQLFHDDEAVAVAGHPQESPAASPDPSARAPSAPVPIAVGREMTSTPDEDFGAFSFKNLPVLKQANDEVIRKLRSDQMVPMTHALSSDSSSSHSRKRSLSQRLKKPPNVVTAVDPKHMTTNPPSPATSTSSIASSPSRGSLPSSNQGSAGGHARKPSEFSTVERFKLNHLEDGLRRNSMPSRLRTASISSGGDGSDTWTPSVAPSQFDGTPPSSVASIDLKRAPDPHDRAVVCLVVEDNPITAKIIETLLIRLGCRCIVVADGAEAISVAMGDIKFDCILMDLHMPVLDGEGAARYIRSAQGKNTHTPIIAVSAYSAIDVHEPNNMFSGYLAKPVQKAELLAAMRRVGFKTSTAQEGGPRATRLTSAS